MGVVCARREAGELDRSGLSPGYRVEDVDRLQIRIDDKELLPIRTEMQPANPVRTWQRERLHQAELQRLHIGRGTADLCDQSGALTDVAAAEMEWAGCGGDDTIRLRVVKPLVRGAGEVVLHEHVATVVRSDQVSFHGHARPDIHPRAADGSRSGGREFPEFGEAGARELLRDHRLSVGGDGEVVDAGFLRRERNVEAGGHKGRQRNAVDLGVSFWRSVVVDAVVAHQHRGPVRRHRDARRSPSNMDGRQEGARLGAPPQDIS